MYTFKTIWCSGAGGGGTQQRFIWGGTSRGLTPYPFEILKCRKTMWCTCKVVDFLIKPLTGKIFGILLEGSTWRFKWHSTLQAGSPIQQLTYYNLLSISKNIYNTLQPSPPPHDRDLFPSENSNLSWTYILIFKCFSLYGMSKLPLLGKYWYFLELLFARIG